MNNYKGVQRIPPFSREETLEYYESGKVPERFRQSYDGHRDYCLAPYISGSDRSDLEYILGGIKHEK